MTYGIVTVETVKGREALAADRVERRAFDGEHVASVADAWLHVMLGSTLVKRFQCAHVISVAWSRRPEATR